jgi:hypothetical protein
MSDDINIHTYPLNDLKEHNTDSEDCWCNPTVEQEENGKLIIHNSLDRRECYETKIH